MASWVLLEADATTDAASRWAPRWIRAANFAVLFITTRLLADPDGDAVATLNAIPTRRRVIAGVVGAIVVAELTYRYAPVQTWSLVFLAVAWSFIRDFSRAQTGWHLPPGGHYLASYLRHPTSPKGAGRPLMEAICANADADDRPLALHVLPGNEALIRLYKSYGFDDHGIGWNDRLVMIRPAS